MPRHEGSRPHEHAIQVACAKLRDDGWTTARPRNANIPIVAARPAAKVLEAHGHAAYDWPPRVDLRRADHAAGHNGMLLGAAGSPQDHAAMRATQASFHAALMRDLEAHAASLAEGGREVLRLFSATPGGYLRCQQPDAIAWRPGAFVAVEATTASPQRMVARYPGFHGVLVARFPQGGVYQDGQPPEVRLVGFGAAESCQK
jgi:hypothetical protein